MSKKNIKPEFISEQADQELEKQGINPASPIPKMPLVKGHIQNRDLGGFVPFQDRKDAENKDEE